MDGSLTVDDPSSASTPAAPVTLTGIDRLDPVQAAHAHALRQFRLARAVCIVAGIAYLFVLTSGLPAPHHAAGTTSASVASQVGGVASPAGGVASSVVPAAGTTAVPPVVTTPLTWDDLGNVPLGSSEELLRRVAPSCAITSDTVVGDHTERAYSCKGAHADSAARFVVVGGVVTQRSTNNLRGERQSATMTPERFAKLAKGMREADALAVTGPCDLGVDQLANSQRVASWTCYGSGSGFVVVVIQHDVVEELINSLST